MGREGLCVGGCRAAQFRTRDVDDIDSELRSVVAVRRATRETGEPLSFIDVVDALLDERLRASRVGYNQWLFLLETPA
jgi:hypothetical protein